jgi:hypothetical protein
MDLAGPVLNRVDDSQGHVGDMFGRASPMNSALSLSGRLPIHCGSQTGIRGCTGKRDYESTTGSSRSCQRSATGVSVGSSSG